MEIKEHGDSFEKATSKSEGEVYWPETQYWVCGDYQDETREMYFDSPYEAKDYIKELEQRPGLISIRIATMIPFHGSEYYYEGGKKVYSENVTLSHGDIYDF